MFMKIPNQSIETSNIYNRQQSEKIEISSLVYFVFSMLNSNFEISIKIFSICSISNQGKKKLSKNTFFLFSFLIYCKVPEVF